MKKYTYQITVLIWYMFFCIFFTSAQCNAENDIKNSIVKIYATTVAPDYQNPWRLADQEQCSGSGCIIDNHFIITNAHIVSNQRFITVRLFCQVKKYKADIIAISHDVDLALLTVNDPSFFNDINPVPLGDLSALQDEVSVYGFPEGGDTLSVTNGCVSRIECRRYIHSSRNYITMQIDAAVNHGNSGGPVITNGKIVGIVMQMLKNSNNISYAVPVPIVKHFLADLKDGEYDGFPRIGMLVQNLENQSLREKYHLKPKQTGVVIRKLIDGAATKSTLEENDIILKIDSYNIANDGSIKFRQRERIDMDYCLANHQIGEKMEFQILRNNVVRNISIKATNDKIFQVPREQYDINSKYYIFGGLVFCPLTANYLQLWGENWEYEAPVEYLYLYRTGFWKKNLQEYVYLLRVFPHMINTGYHEMSDIIITQINGVPIINLKHMVSLIENSTARLIEFKMKIGGSIVIDKKKAIETRKIILKEYGVEKDKSL